MVYFQWLGLVAFWDFFVQRLYLVRATTLPPQHISMASHVGARDDVRKRQKAR